VAGWEGAIFDREVEMVGSWRGWSDGDEEVFYGGFFGVRCR
jgi:hypothetical protein